MANLSMDCGLIRKAKRVLSIFFVLLFFSSTLTSCYTIYPFITYPEDIATEWVCEDPYIRLVLDRYSPDYSSLEFCGETIDIDIGFLYSEYEVYPAGSLQGDSLLFSGEFRYSINKKKLIFTINHDYLFDGKYKKLVFTPVPGTEVTTK